MAGQGQVRARARALQQTRDFRRLRNRHDQQHRQQSTGVRAQVTEHSCRRRRDSTAIARTQALEHWRQSTDICRAQLQIKLNCNQKQKIKAEPSSSARASIARTPTTQFSTRGFLTICFVDLNRNCCSIAAMLYLHRNPWWKELFGRFPNFHIFVIINIPAPYIANNYNMYT